MAYLCIRWNLQSREKPKQHKEKISTSQRDSDIANCTAGMTKQTTVEKEMITVVQNPQSTTVFRPFGINNCLGMVCLSVKYLYTIERSFRTNQMNTILVFCSEEHILETATTG